MAFFEKLRMRDLNQFFAAQKRAALSYVVDEATDTYVPMTVGMLTSGSAGGGGAVTTAPATVKDPGGKTLTVGSGQVALGTPAGANTALVQVTAGAVAWAFGEAGPGTGQLATGELLTLSGEELAAVRLTRSGSSDAQVYVSWGTL